MAHLRPIELKLVSVLFETKPGYVLDFSDRTFREFFRDEVGVNIDDRAYLEGGTSKAKRLRTFLQIGQRAAVAAALVALWEYREADRVRAGIIDLVPNLAEQLSAIVERLGGKAIQSPPGVPGTPIRPAVSHPPLPANTFLADLETSFSSLHALEPQPRGYAFEKFLKRLFDTWSLDARGSFRVVGEQIDGSFQHDGATYLVEAKWHNSPCDASDLRAFQGKVEDRPDWTRGLFISYSGFTEDGLQAFVARRVILMDGLDISDLVTRRISMASAITAKSRYASEMRKPFARVRNLFPI